MRLKMLCWIWVLVLFVGCAADTEGEPERYEGAEPGDCTDHADNDQDGRFDCDDDGCAGSPDCRETSPRGDADLVASDDARPISDAGPPQDAGLVVSEPTENPCADRPTIKVATDGSDGPECGGDDAPCASIRHALSLATDGDAVCVGPGTYLERWIVVPSGVWLVGEQGPAVTAINSRQISAVRLENIERAGLQGFEIYGDWAQGDPGDGLVRVLNASDITLRDLIIHDAPYDQDCVKVSGQVRRLLMDRIIAWNPGPRDQERTTWQELVDLAGIDRNSVPGDPPPVSQVTLRNSWLFHVGEVGDWLTYTKINTENVLYENNIFGPSAGGGFGNGGVGVGTGEAGLPVSDAIVANHVIVRNNLFVGVKGDAVVTIQNAADVWLYGNTFYGNSGDKLRALVMLRGNRHPLGRVRIYGNIFQNNHPSKEGETFFWVRTPLADDFEHDHNLYLDNIEHTETPYRGEANGVYDLDPQLNAPAIPNADVRTFERMAEIVANFVPSVDSSVRAAGVDMVDQAGHPNWHPGVTDRRWDLLGRPRPVGPWDLGAIQVRDD